MQYSGAGGKLIHQKNQKQKISWHCPFNKFLLPVWLQSLDPDSGQPWGKVQYPDPDSYWPTDYPRKCFYVFKAVLLKESICKQFLVQISTVYWTMFLLKTSCQTVPV